MIRTGVAWSIPWYLKQNTNQQLGPLPYINTNMSWSLHYTNVVTTLYTLRGEGGKTGGWVGSGGGGGGGGHGRKILKSLSSLDHEKCQLLTQTSNKSRLWKHFQSPHQSSNCSSWSTTQSGDWLQLHPTSPLTSPTSQTWDTSKLSHNLWTVVKSWQCEWVQSALSPNKYSTNSKKKSSQAMFTHAQKLVCCCCFYSVGVDCCWVRSVTTPTNIVPSQKSPNKQCSPKLQSGILLPICWILQHGSMCVCVTVWVQSATSPANTLPKKSSSNYRAIFSLSLNNQIQSEWKLIIISTVHYDT